MEFRGIRQTSHINAVNRNPGIDEHGKTLVWDNNLIKFKYVLISNLNANSKTDNGYVVKGNDSTGADFIWKLDANKNPSWRREEYLKTVARQAGGNSIVFTMNGGSSKTAALGALAWLDTVPLTIPLPGNARVLFDDNGSIGGISTLTVDKANQLLQFSGFTGITAQNNADSTQKSVLQYFGSRNLMLANGTIKPLVWGDNLINNIFIGDSTGGGSTNAQNNLRIGHFAGANAAIGMQGGVFVGNYSGRLETANNAFYLGNTNYGTLDDFKTKSLMYGDFSTNWLRINNRLEIPQEVKIGTFDVANTPSAGMIQFVPYGLPGEMKPQFFDGSLWLDFATGANNYLSSVTKATADVGTTDNAYKLTFVRNGLADFLLQLGANAFNSTVIPSALPTAASGYLQLSSGDIDDGNRGFAYTTDLRWDQSRQELAVNGSLLLAPMTLTSPLDGVIKYDGSHFYGYAKTDDGITSEWRILDAPGTGEPNTASNAGTGGVGVWFDKSGFDLRFKNIKSTDPRIVVTDSAGTKTIDLSTAITLLGSNVAPVTVKTYSGSVFGSVATPTGVSPEVKFKKLISNTVQITENANEVILEVTGVGGGESNSAINIGTGIPIYKDKVGADLRFKSIKAAGNHITTSANVDGLQLNIDGEDITFTNLGTGVKTVTQDGVNSYVFTQKTWIDGTATTIEETTNNLKIDINTDIPAIIPTPTPEWVLGGAPGQGTLNFKSTFSADVRTSGVLTPTTFYTLKIGPGLFYDYTTNTLTSTSSGGSATDYVLSNITRTPATNTLNFISSDPVGGSSDIIRSYTLGSLAFLDSLATEYSLVGDGTSGNKFKLVNDVASPGATRYYGTDADGIKGFYDVAGINGGTVTQVFPGNGMAFSPIYTAGIVAMGTPSTIDSTTTNEVLVSSHTHELGVIAADSVSSGSAVEYGALYNWYTVIDVRNIAPVGWHVPTQAEVIELQLHLGGESVAGGRLKEIGFIHWNSPNTGATNESGFNGRGAGIRLDGEYNSIMFDGLLVTSQMWTTTTPYSSSAQVFLLMNNDGSLYSDVVGNKKQGCSVRLIKDDSTLSSMVGNDGKIYNSVKIGSQVWMSENLNETKYRNGDWIHGFENGVYLPISTPTWAALTTEAMCYYLDNEEYGGGKVPLSSNLDNLQYQIDNIPPQIQSDYTQANTNALDYIKNKPTLLALGDWIEDISFEFADVVAGTAKTYVLDIKASYAYLITSACLETDNGTLTGVFVAINGISPLGLSSVTVDTIVDETAAGGGQTVNPGDRVTISTSTGYTGTPTLLRGKLKTVRTPGI